MNSPVSFVDKYRPRGLPDLVLPAKHGLSASIQFLNHPYPSGWLLYGKPGIGKSSMASIMALRASHSFGIRAYSGPDLNVDVVRQIKEAVVYRPLYGNLHTVIVHEADSIPRVAQVRLLDLLDDLAGSRLVMIFTSNDTLSDFEDRFVSRLKTQLFSAQGIAPEAQVWLMKIAALENIPLTPAKAQRIIKLAKNNLRTALQQLELLGAERPPTWLVAPGSPEANFPFDLADPIGGGKPANRQLTAVF